MFLLADYTLTEKIHEGSDAVIQRGIRNLDRRPVLVKWPRDMYPSPRVLAGLQHEYNLLYGLDLPGVLEVVGLERYEHGLALILEDFDGVGLDRMVAGRRLDVETVLRIAVSLSKTLAALHAQPILHKDIKPHNILLDPRTHEVRLVDFSLATRLSQEPQRPVSYAALEGTPAYMSPEQTGRMNRCVDPRSDLYSFGVTLYELLTGVLPFEAGDPIQMIHDHLSRAPVPPSERDPRIPEALSDLVMKLLAKSAEDRYQSASGLRADLEACLERLATSGRIDPFPLGRHDHAGELRIPQRLYGREEEISALSAAFARVQSGAVELFLLSGYAGVGKSALVQEAFKGIDQHRAYFITGKFDQLGRHVPYAPIARAFRQLVQKLLTLPPDVLESWKQTLLVALGPNGQLLIDLIPELALVLGPQPTLPELGPTEASNRFSLVFQNFLRVFATAEHPLILFLDDLQWADPASLKLLQILLRDPGKNHLLLVGAYRDREVDASHPLYLNLGELRKAGAVIHELHLGPLALPHVDALLADTLLLDKEEVGGLARLIWEKTRGNPFFLGQLLKSLVRDGLLEFDAHAGRFRWDLERIAGARVSDNVVEFMVERLRRLSPSTQRILMLAACIGHQFDIGILASLEGKSRTEYAPKLWEALQEGLLLPMVREYRFLPSGNAPSEGALDEALAQSLLVSCRFLHDRVQQAAYALVPEDERPDLHLRIGRRLREERRLAQGDEGLFELVNHLNRGAARITEADERLDLAQLNLDAGRRAKAATAYATAASYFGAGIALLDDGWASAYELTFDLHIGWAECEYLSGRCQEAESLFDLLLSRARSTTEKAHVYSLRIVLYTTLGRFTDAVEAGRLGLNLFGFDLPGTEPERQAALEAALAEVESTRAGRSMEELREAPAMASAEHYTVSKLLSELVAPGYFVSPTLFGLVTAKLVAVTQCHGNSELAPNGYLAYGFLLASSLGRPAEAYAIGRLGLDLHEKYHDSTFTCRLTSFFGFYLHVCKPLRMSIPYLREAIQQGLETGDLAYASFACHHLGFMRMGLGDELSALGEEIDKLLVLMERTQDAVSIRILTLTRQAIANLEGRTRSPQTLNDDRFDEQAFLAEAEATGFPMGRCYYHFLKLQLLFLHGDHRRALDMSIGAEALEWSAVGLQYRTELPFYACLTRAALYPAATAAEQAQYAEAMKRFHARIAVWAEGCPENYRHQRLLVEAEMARVFGREVEAMGLYEEAIAAAREGGFGHHAAIAAELCARLHLARGRAPLAGFYLREAQVGYLRWGALSKARALTEQHPELTGASGDLAPQRLMTTATLKRSSGEAWIDMVTVIRTAQAISGEMVLDKVLEQLMRSVLESAGAQRGFLLIPRDDRLVIAAAMHTQPDLLEIGLDEPLREGAPLSTTVVHYVERSREAVILGNAAADRRFAADPYIASAQPKSVLCLSLLHQGRLAGILYLENNAVCGVFTEERVEILRLLSSQAAIAMENARLYADVQRAHREVEQANVALEREVEQRTRELRLANERLENELADRGRAERERAALQEEIIQVQRRRLEELSTPLIPISDDIVVMPLIGAMDTERAEQMLETALHGAARSGARIVILDITGMTTMDGRVAETLLRTAQSLSLLGAHAVLTGMRPTFAQLLVTSGVDLGNLVTHGTLKSGIAYALGRGAAAGRGPGARARAR